MALGRIIAGAQENRTDLDNYDHRKKQDLWRGGGMTAAELKEYLEMEKRITLHGYTSCSLAKNVAL